MQKNGEPVGESRRALVTVERFDTEMDCIHVVGQPRRLVTRVVTRGTGKERSHLRLVFDNLD